MAKDVLNFLPYLGWREWHVSESSPDMITCRPICLRLVDSPLCPLCKSAPMTGEHLSDCPTLLHVLSQDNSGVLPPASTISALYWTARHLKSERTLARQTELKIEQEEVKQHKSLSQSFKLCLRPIMSEDVDPCIWVDGYKNLTLTSMKNKHPFILPSKSRLSQLPIMKEHQRLHHAS
ncbi:hypothetical protein TNCV_4543231 [Trichonephila clavipes]|nr:hypothetical protein TNCV_4543231 [Trichonephila clavipes]